MRLHHLRVTAFGPFAGTVEVDLDRVTEGGLFLIRGATGAGKTSLLDAVAFALFADIPGARSKKGLHSDHSDRGSVPQVSLEFTAGGRRLRIDRSPEFRRPKTRGNGDTKVPAKALLFEQRGGEWEALSGRHDEIADVVSDVLGMGMEQFSKVVLLPQGDFAAFLRATPEERRGLLERLFDVSTYTGVEDWLARRRRDSAAILQEHRERLAADLGVLVEVLAGAPSDGGADRRDADRDSESEVDDHGVTSLDWADVPVTELPDHLERLRAELESTAALRLAQLDAARLADVEAGFALATATALASARERGLRARSQLADLEESSAAQHDALQRLESARRAAAVSGDLKAAERAEHELLVADQSAAAARERLSALDISDGSLHAVDDLLERLTTGGEALTEAGHRCIAAAERARRRADVVGRLATLGGQAEALAAQLLQSRAALDRATADLASARAAGQALPSATRELADVRVLHRLRREQDAGTSALGRAKEALVTARGTAQDLRQSYQDLVQARLDGMAAELARGLTPGSSCPVCGSTEHPRQAVEVEAVTPDQLAEAESRWQAAADSAAELAESVAALKAGVDQRAERLAGEQRGARALAVAVIQAETVHGELARQAATLPALEAAAAELETALATLTTRRSTIADEVTSATAALDTLDRDLVAELSGLGQVLERHRRACPCRPAHPELETPGTTARTTITTNAAAVSAEALQQLRRHHDGVVGGVRTLQAAQADRVRAGQAVRQAQDVVSAALAEHGFGDVASARAAVLPPVVVAELEELVRSWTDTRAAARAVLAERGVVEALAAPEPDLARLAAQAERARTVLLAATSAETLVRRSLDGLRRVADSIAQRCEQIRRALADHEVLSGLADAVAGTGGSNSLRMRLSAFVLAARLETVAVLANERLRTMGEGRYQLRHTDGLAARGARSGLGLEVLDLWTGQARDTSSLSGGESFMASLALALGLADAVREEAGGFDLQTLFIDEGFGTLDDESLEQVMDVLDGLREGGRAVGVVSHVAELRSRIPSQVVVTKSERGSSVRVRMPDEAPAA